MAAELKRAPAQTAFAFVAETLFSQSSPSFRFASQWAAPSLVRSDELDRLAAARFACDARHRFSLMSQNSEIPTAIGR
jgi:hypothetical protein